MAIEIFTRREQKYLITIKQYKALIERISLYMRPDLNGVNGRYTVTSLYFDNAQHSIYFETKNKLRFRQKLRLRVYDETDIDGTAFFEVKQKHKKVVNKRRMVLPLMEAYRYLIEDDSSIPLEAYETSNTQVLKEIDHFRHLYGLRPEMIISYDRHALHGIDDDGLRITFDLNLRCRNHDLFVENGPEGEHFIDNDLVILEVKVNNSVPLWLTRILQELECKQQGSSKFCTSLEHLRKDELPNGIEEEKILIAGGV